MRKNIKGITLISLVIMIVLMLILVTIAITNSIDEDGIFSGAKESKFKENISSLRLEFDRKMLAKSAIKDFERESVNIAADSEELIEYMESLENKKYSEYKKILCISAGELCADYDTVTDDQKIWLSDLGILAIDKDKDNLAKYLLGEDYQGTTIMDIAGGTGIYDYTTGSFAETDLIDLDNLQLVNKGNIPIVYYVGEYSDSNDNLITQYIAYCRYNDKTYKVLVESNSRGTLWATKPLDENNSIEQVEEYSESSKVGKIVKYDFVGEDSLSEDWEILYDDSEHGLQLISLNALQYDGATLRLGGYNDTYLRKIGTIGQYYNGTTGIITLEGKDVRPWR